MHKNFLFLYNQNNTNPKPNTIMKNLLLLIVFTFFSLSSSYAQYALAWEEKFGGEGDDVATAVIETSDNGIVVVGTTKSNELGTSDILIIKLDAQGNYLWEKVYGGSDYEFAYSVAETYDNGLVVAGSTASESNGGHDLWVLRLDAYGNLLWDKKMGGAGHDFAKSVIETHDTGIVMAGYTKSKGAGYSDFWIIKLSASGNRIWEKTFGGANFDEATDIIETTDNELTVVGYTRSKGAGSHDFWIIKMSSNGNYIWDKTYGGEKHDLSYAIMETQEKGYYVVGKTSSQGAGYSDMWVFELDYEGNKKWGQIYGRGSSDAAFAVTTNPNNELLIAGFTKMNYTGFDAQLLNLNQHGQVLWDYNFGSENWDEANDIVATADGGAVMVGYTKPNGDSDFWITKFKPLFLSFPDFEPIADVDKNIPVATNGNNQTLAVVIGIEEYRNLPSALYAKRDAQAFYQYARNTLDIPGDNIYYLANEQATFAEFFSLFSEQGWLSRNSDRYTDIVIYYAGHGSPDPKSRQAYLLPYDMLSDPHSNGFSLQKILTDLEKTNARSVTVFVDACFSGIDRQNQLVFTGKRAMLANPLKLNQNSNVSIITASTGLQYGGTYEEQKHGLFTYFLLQGLQGAARGTDNIITTKELFEYIQKNVKNYSLSSPDIQQTPVISGYDLDRTFVEFE